MESVKLDPDRVKLALNAEGGLEELAYRLDRTTRQVRNYLKGSTTQRYVAEQIENIVRESERKIQKKAL